MSLDTINADNRIVRGIINEEEKIMKKKLLSLFSVSLLVMTVLSGCSDSTGSSIDNSSVEPNQGTETSVSTEVDTKVVDGPVYGGSAVVGIQQDIDSLDPHKATAAGTKEILFNIFEGLVKPDVDGNLANAICKDYTISEDGLVYTFELRDGVKFHNGNDVTAEDVKYSIERVSGLLDGTPLMSTMKTVQAVEILDDNKVQVTVGSANVELIYSFTLAIIPAGSGEEENATPIGTGPFKFVAYTPQEGIKVAKFDQYWQEGIPYLDDVYFKIVSGSDAALMELQGGTIDVYSYLTASQVSVLENQFQIISSPSTVVQALFLNNADELLKDVRVRQAICYAISADEISEFVDNGNGTPVSSAMLPTLKAYYEDTTATYGTSANVEKAKALLSEAGYPDGIDLEITIPSVYEFHMQTGEVIVEELKAAGIRATINPVEWETWLNDAYNGRQYQTTISGITSDMTPGYLLNRFVSDSKKNFINYSNSDFDALYAKVAASLDAKEREAGYKELQRIMTEDAATAFIQVPANVTALAKNLEGYKFYPVYVQDMSTVYFTEAK